MVEELLRAAHKLLGRTCPVVIAGLMAASKKQPLLEMLPLHVPPVHEVRKLACTLTAALALFSSNKPSLCRKYLHCNPVDCMGQLPEISCSLNQAPLSTGAEA